MTCPERLAEVDLRRRALADQEQIVDVSAGSLLTLEGSQLHDLEARRDSVVLLTLSWPATASNS